MSDNSQMSLSSQLESMKAKLEALQIAHRELQEKFAIAQKALAHYQYLPEDYERKITFGTWPIETDSSERRDIPWYVLYRENNPEKGVNRAFVVSKYALLQKRFDGESSDWVSSELRQWLNNEFLQLAFSAEEQGRLIPAFNGKPVDVEAQNKLKSVSLEGGAEIENATSPAPTNVSPESYDKVFLLSMDEAQKYFKSNEARKCGLWPHWENNCYWWLRSARHSDVDCIYRDGEIYDDYGFSCCSVDCMVRPAMWVKVLN